MARVTARVSRGDQLDRSLEETFTELYRVALPRVVRTARARAPVKTGRLRRGITAQRVFARRNAVIETEAPYTVFQECGTATIQAKRFIATALEDTFRGIDRIRIPD